MKLYKRHFHLISFIAILTLVTACGNGGSESTSSSIDTEVSDSSEVIEEVTIQMGGITSPDHPLTLGGEKFKKLVEERTDGKVIIEFYPNNQLGSIREQTEQVQLGTIQMTQTLLSTITSFDAETLQVFEYPFLWPSDEDEIWKALEESELGDIALSSLENRGFKGFGFWAGGFKAMTNNDKPILSPDDLKGVNMRVIPSEILQRMFEKYGANPVPIEFAETYNALQQGVVDAQENPLETIRTHKFYEVQDHLTVTEHGYQFYMFVANLDWFNGLSPELQEILIEAEEEARVFARDLTREKSEQTLNEFPDLGLDVHELPEEGREEFVELSMPLHEEFNDTPEKQELLEKLYEELGIQQ